MPTSEEILAGLTQIANDWTWLAIGWHVYLAVLVGILLVGRQLSRRLVGGLLALPLLSVSAMAWTVGNPFNGTVFAAVGVALLVIAVRMAPERAQVSPPWLLVLGSGLFLFGWVYPHFLETGSGWTYLYAAPTGLVPCPTLTAVIGISLMLGGLGSRAWMGTLGAVGLVYGVIGALRLGVLIDGVLILGALIILGTTVMVDVATRRPAHTASTR